MFVVKPSTALFHCLVAQRISWNEIYFSRYTPSRFRHLLPADSLPPRLASKYCRVSWVSPRNRNCLACHSCLVLGVLHYTRNLLGRRNCCRQRRMAQSGAHVAKRTLQKSPADHTSSLNRKVDAASAFLFFSEHCNYPFDIPAPVPTALVYSMDDLDPYRDMPPPPDDEPLLPAFDAVEEDTEMAAILSGVRERQAEQSSVRRDRGLGQGGLAMARRREGSRGSAQASCITTCCISDILA